ncbi:hypothetical protein [Chryseobacterium indoltheticum]|uniref:hypothetical protein n=1 Tax=Chryseobacterium indoltheticum TaxID=254 RepID=UPI003F494A23
MASFVDVGPFDGQNIRQGYDKNWVKEKLRANLPPESEDAVLFANGLDPALLTPYSKDNFKDIDYMFLNDVSTTIPIMVISASGHTVYINSPAISKVYQKNEAALIRMDMKPKMNLKKGTWFITGRKRSFYMPFPRFKHKLQHWQITT